MSSTSPDTETSCRKKIVISILCILFSPVIVFLGAILIGPLYYFMFLMKRDLNKMYLAKGIRLSGTVLHQWTNTSEGKDGTITSYHVKVLYEAPGGGMYVKNFEVTQYEQRQANLQLIILPQYPASAIPYFQVDPLEQWMPFATKEWSSGDTQELFHVGFSFFLVSAWNIGFTGFVLSAFLFSNIWAVVPIVVCEVCISFVIGYFMSFYMKHDEVQNIMFDATPYDESSRNVPQPRPPMPQITYKEIFPHGTFTFCSILQSIVIDHLKFCVYGLLFTLGIYLMIALGAGVSLIIPEIDERTKRRISEQYIANGTIVEGKVVHRFSRGRKARVQYAVTDTSTSNILRYEKTIPGSHLIRGTGQVQIPDNLRLYILHPDLPCSARFADEIELHDKILVFKCQTNKRGRLTLYIIFLALQQSICVWLLCYQPVTGIAWSLSIISTCAILLGVQLFTGWGFATLRRHRVLKDMVHDATQLFDVEIDISLKSGAVDNTLALGDSTTTSGDGLDSEYPLRSRLPFQGEVLYDKIHPLD
jgi:hypothetical protein